MSHFPTPAALIESAPAPGSGRHSDESIKDTFESIVIAFILAFVFRAYVVEAFVIPTGSMAPTLLGQHVTLRCPECGYDFKADLPESDSSSPRTTPKGVCPMCHLAIPIASGTRLSAGDRILVHKYLYSITEPKRWDVVVFKNPQDPKVNFIKRLIGLPNEQLWIIDGNIYTSGADGQFTIARKSDRPIVQRAVWQPIYHSQFVPLDGGTGGVRGVRHAWATPWISEEPDDWSLEGRSGYQFKGSGRGAIHFSFERAVSGGNTKYAYNQFMDDDHWGEPIEDVRVAAMVQPAGPGLDVTLQTTSRLDDASSKPTTRLLAGRIDAKGQATLQAIDPVTKASRELAKGEAGAFAPGTARRVELWYVDQEASLWVDGRRVCQWRFDLPISAIEDRAPPDRFPEISIHVEGAAATLREVEVDRDLYYSSSGSRGELAEGGLVKVGDQRIGTAKELGADEFFCMGDNSPRSHDSRFWQTVNPWIRLRMFNEVERRGVVPRKLMIGRAFFVYFPAPFGWSPTSNPVFPNFGEMRMIH
ncbi:MAG: signal peptidase I [Planctomycetota bacterium]|nr:signal peptidase I [Planctomycetota bacterium]